MNTKNENINTLKILNQKEVYQVKNEDEKLNFGSLTCFGGGSFHRGLSIGMQEKMISGLLVYDNENFYGFSEKHGLTLMSENKEFKELEMPRFDSSLENKQKELNIDLTLVDTQNFYIRIPNEIERFNIDLLFNVNFNYDDESVINKINIYFINDTQKNVKFIFKNKNMYKKGDDFINNQGSIIHFESTYLNKNYSICSIHQYKK
jgi:hypothetical protein